MDLIQCKVALDHHILSHIAFIRKFDRSLSVGEMKQKTENGLFAIEFDLEYFDALEDRSGTDRKDAFRESISQLINPGVNINDTIMASLLRSNSRITG